WIGVGRECQPVGRFEEGSRAVITIEKQIEKAWDGGSIGQFAFGPRPGFALFVQFCLRWREVSRPRFPPISRRGVD
ncbi:MAG: hypothetical protein JXR83_17340, partial [Deltaproteobacteria bacterium]|nr:hypothetical protein [Deltaproteobacteria bacterium]